MSFEPSLPFGIQSIVPGLDNVPKPNKQSATFKPKLPDCLRLSPELRNTMEKHLGMVGVERRSFGYTVKDQSTCITQFQAPDLNLHQSPFRRSSINHRDAWHPSSCQWPTQSPVQIHQPKVHSKASSSQERRGTTLETLLIHLPVPMWCRSH